MWTAEKPAQDCTPDRRRTPRADIAGRIVQRADALSPQDRALVQTIFELGRPAAEVGRLLGLEGNVRTLRRRIRNLTARILAPEFAFVLGNRDAWTPARRTYATEHYILGRSCRHIARDHHTTYYVVRTHLRFVREMARGGQP